MKFFMMMNMHFLVMGAKTSPTNLYFRSLEHHEIHDEFKSDHGLNLSLF